MNALQLIEFFNYDYKYLAILLLVVEQREGRETVDRLLDEIPAPPVQKNAKHFVTRLRELVDEEAGQDQKSESRKLPGKKSMASRS